MYLFPAKPISNFSALYLFYKTLQEDIFLLLTINTKDIFLWLWKKLILKRLKKYKFMYNGKISSNLYSNLEYHFYYERVL